MANFNVFSYYFDAVNNIHGSASYFGRGVCPSNPKRYFYLGDWQASQASLLPYVENQKVFRNLRGKKVEIKELSERLAKFLAAQ